MSLSLSLYIPIIVCYFGFVSSQYALLNDTNQTIANLSTTKSAMTTTEFQTSIYIPPDNETEPSLNQTGIMRTTLSFDNPSPSLIIDLSSIEAITSILGSVLELQLINEFQAPVIYDLFYIYPSPNHGNGASINLAYITWNMSMQQNATESASNYIQSTKFNKQFNRELTVQSSSVSHLQFVDVNYLQINLENGEFIEIALSTTSTTPSPSSEIDDEFILPQHFQQYMILYAILLCVISLCLLCFICWCCTKHCFGTDKFMMCSKQRTTNGVKEHQRKKNKALKQRRNSKLHKKEEGDMMETTNFESNRKWDEAEQLMNVYDDDGGAITAKSSQADDTVDDHHDNTYLIGTVSPHKSIVIGDHGHDDDNDEGYDELLTLKQKIELQNAFDEE